ncbi:MAG: hypothetical protein AB1791_05030 [Chloroflexota bacterium]
MELTWYVTVLRRYWRILVLGALLPAVAAVVASLLLPKSYEAQAQVVLYRTSADVTFDPRFQTVAEDQSVNFNNPQDPRRQTVAALAMSDAVLAQTLASLPADMQAGWSLTALKNGLEVSVVGNLFQLNVQADSPETAAAIANTWATTVTQFTNDALRQQTTTEAMSEQVQAALADYEQAQTALQTFLQSNRLNQLELQIGVKERAIADAQDVFQSSAETELSANLAASEHIPLLIHSAEALRELLAQSRPGEPVAAATELTLLYLQAGALSAGVTLPGELQLALTPNSADSLTAAEAIDLLDQLILALQSLQARLDEEVAGRSQALLAGGDLEATLAGPIQEAQAEINQLQAELETEQARQRELTTGRDLAWENYLTLRRKLAEVAIVEQTAETEVVLAAPAVAPEKPAGPNLLLNTAVALALGGMVTLAAVFLKAHLDRARVDDH